MMTAGSSASSSISRVPESHGRRACRKAFGQSETVGFAIVGGTQDHESSLAVLRPECGVSIAIGLPAAERTHVRSRDRDRLRQRPLWHCPFKYSFKVAFTVSGFFRVACTSMTRETGFRIRQTRGAGRPVNVRICHRVENRRC